MSDHPKPSITSDVVVYHNGQILLIERAKDPFKGSWALPGGHFDINKDISIQHGGLRELEEETHITAKIENLYYVGYWDAPDRDPRGRYIGFCWAYFASAEDVKSAHADDDAKRYAWFPIKKLPELHFSHDEMIKLADRKYFYIIRTRIR